MANALKLARDKIAVLKAQVAELERFIAMHEMLLTGGTEQQVQDRMTSIMSGKNASGNETSKHIPVDTVENSRRGRAGKMRPDHTAELMQRIIREVGRPLTRGELVQAFESRDVQIPYSDKGRYIGTIAWRNKGIFENIEGRGYWLRELPVPPLSTGQSVLPMGTVN
jgi:hypothetical protein